MVYVQMGVYGEWQSETMHFPTVKLAVQFASNQIRMQNELNNEHALPDHAYSGTWMIQRDKNMQSERHSNRMQSYWVEIRRYP